MKHEKDSSRVVALAIRYIYTKIFNSNLLNHSKYKWNGNSLQKMLSHCTSSTQNTRVIGHCCCYVFFEWEDDKRNTFRCR